MGRVRVLHILSIGVLTAAVGWFAPARAQDDPEALMREGNALRARGQTSRALGLFKRAYDVARSPRAAAQLGLCEFALKSYLDAMNHLSEALASHDRWIEENRAQLEKPARDLKKHLAEVAVSGAPAGAAVELDGKTVGTLPAATAWALPGRLSLVVKAPGFEEGSRVVEMSGGERREERFELKPLPARAVEPVAARDVALAAPVATAGGAGAPADHGPPSLVTSPSSAPPETAAPIYKRWWFWTALGAVAAGTAVLVVTHPWRSNSPCDGAGSPCTVW